jgi:hypothetical protein
MWVAVLPSMVNFRSSIRAFVIMSKPQNVKNRWVSMPSPSAALAEHQPRVGHVEVALGADDGELAAGRGPVTEVGARSTGPTPGRAGRSR